MSHTTYKKRSGTSGIQGQLYETKLMSLIYYRMIHDDSVEQFSLATNKDDIGAFDDIAFKAKIKGFDKPIAVFIQAKHRENDKQLVITNQADLNKYFDSFLEIKRAFDPKSKDMIFGGDFDGTECFFVMYTTAKDDPKNKIYEGRVADYLNKLIGTGGCCTQPTCKDEDLEFLCKIAMKEEITTLAEQLAKFICEKPGKEISMNNNDLLLRYHVILTLNVLDVSDIEPAGHRLASFRKDFFASNEEFLVLFKNTLCLEVLKKLKPGDKNSHSLLLQFLSEPSDVTILSKLIGSVLTYTRKKDKLEFVSKSTTDDVKRQLEKANIPPSTVYEAAELGAKDYILSRTFKVPAYFGNKDLAIRGTDKKIDQRLNHLTTKIIELLKQLKDTKIVTIDESLEAGFIQLNGGIASAVGNILVFDETAKLLKFTDNCESLGKLAKTWYETLTSKVENLHEYKLDVKVKQFPKLSFKRGVFDEDLVRDFYSKLLFYTNQAAQNRVENILKEEIKNHPHNNDVKNFGDRSELIFLKYHDDIQKQWMAPKEGSYLTKKSKIYQNAVTYALNESLMGVLKNMHMIKNQDYRFIENAIKQFGLQGQIIGTIIVSESCVLTVAKVEQYLGNKDHAVLDLEYIFKLPLNSHKNICKELAETSQEKIFILVCNQLQDIKYFMNRLEDIAKAVDGKQILVITSKDSVDIMTKYFSKASNVWNDGKSAFADLTVESQEKFLATYKIKLQGEDIILNKIVDEKSVALINEVVFYKIINNETVEIGNPANFKDYEKQFYIARRVSRIKKKESDKFENVKDKVLETFFDLKDDIVLITAEKGMGKSTLLSHLTLKTKERDPAAWIVRIYLPDYDRIFRTYQIVIEPVKSLEFMCQVALGDESIEFMEKAETEESTNEIIYHRKRSGDNFKEFQLKLFLHYYTRGKLIFVIDGFDKINPECEIIFGQWLTCIKKQRRMYKIWITSSPSSRLENWVGPSYKIENFSHLDQAAYLTSLWKHKIQFKNLYNENITNVEDFVDYMHRKKNKSQYLRAYVLFLDFLKMETPAAGIEFPYDEYYNHFLTRFGLCESTIPWIPNDIKPKHLYRLAKNFDIDNEGRDRMFYEVSRGNYADF